MKNLAPLVARDKFNTRVQKFAEPRGLIAAYKTDKRLLLFQYIIPWMPMVKIPRTNVTITRFYNPNVSYDSINKYKCRSVKFE